jgi:hypothetical protein
LEHQMHCSVIYFCILNNIFKIWCQLGFNSLPLLSYLLFSESLLNLCQVTEWFRLHVSKMIFKKIKFFILNLFFNIFV